MSEKEKSTSLVEVISAAIKIPGVKVNRDIFLREAFKKASSEKMERILEVGPVAAGCTRKQLKNIANYYVNLRTLTSTGISFVTGLPGGLAMTATIPADTLQYFAVAIRLAQEIAYIYGAEDLWCDEKVDMEKIQTDLILYCGVMFGASGASATLRVLTAALAKQALKKIPRMAANKIFLYHIAKSIARVVGLKMSKNIFAKGVAKALPIIGGVFSGTLTFVTMRPMGHKLIEDLDEARFDYSQEELEADLKELQKKFGLKIEEPIETTDFCDSGANTGVTK